MSETLTTEKKQHYFSLEDAVNEPWRLSSAKIRLNDRSFL